VIRTVRDGPRQKPMLLVFGMHRSNITRLLARSDEGSRREDLPTQARVQGHRLSSGLALREWIPRAMDHHLPAEKFPTCASGRQDRGPVTLLGFRRSFHLTRPRDLCFHTSTGRPDRANRSNIRQAESNPHVERPKPKSDEILVHNRAVSVNSVD
jgi:hypothetical protein